MSLKRYNSGAFKDVASVKKFANGSTCNVSSVKRNKNGEWVTVWPVNTPNMNLGKPIDSLLWIRSSRWTSSGGSRNSYSEATNGIFKLNNNYSRNSSSLVDIIEAKSGVTNLGILGATKISFTCHSYYGYETDGGIGGAAGSSCPPGILVRIDTNDSRERVSSGGSHSFSIPTVTATANSGNMNNFSIQPISYYSIAHLHTQTIYVWISNIIFSK